MLTLILMLIAQTPTDDAVTALRAYNIPRHSELWIELSPVLNNPEKVAGLQRKYQVDDDELALIKKVAVKDRWQLGAGLSWHGDQIVNHVLNLRRGPTGAHPQGHPNPRRAATAEEGGRSAPGYPGGGGGGVGLDIR